eukprot:TRINITY_DN868_c0_g1_i3.p1 TRINITY_DN868_c0_g1~~TRINITY_DN868_c0_g1_i3.p1  ORF type:complete len:200 (+),score=32.00 TRINITY_DN868_c0_g1_i3:298-897(+)
MKLAFLFVQVLGAIVTSKGNDQVVVTEEQVVAALNEKNTEVINQAVDSGASEVVASAFSIAQQSGNSKVLAKFFYQVFSTNPPGSFISNQMLDIMEQIKDNLGCDQIDQILWEIDSLIENDEISEKLQAAIYGSDAIMVCVGVPQAIPSQNQCKESQSCIFLNQESKHLLNSANQCHTKRVCRFLGFDEDYICVRECEQ